MEIERIGCPRCGASGEKSLKKGEDGRLVCRYCGSIFNVPENTLACPACGSCAFSVSTLGDGMLTCNACGSIFKIVK